jgi:hypothetical protein
MRKSTNIVMNQVTLVAQEAPVTFGKVKIQPYIDIYNTKISYALAIILHEMGDMKACFCKVRGSWGRRLLAVAREVTRHGRAHPYSWLITIVSLRSKESEESHRSEWKTKLLSMFLAVTCQHTSGGCQSHSCPVLNLHEASRKYVELSPSSPPFLTLRFYEKDLTPTPNLLQISGRYSFCSGIFDTPSARAYLFSPLKVIQVNGSVG